MGRFLADGTAIVATASQIYKLDGSTLTSLAGAVPDARFIQPRWVSANTEGTLFVLDYYSDLYQITRAGQVSKLLRLQSNGRSPSQIMMAKDGMYVAYAVPAAPLDHWITGGAFIEFRRAADGYSPARRWLGPPTTSCTPMHARMAREMPQRSGWPAY